MATLRPHIIRADTLDLQDHENPSAQNHAHIDTDHIAPHQHGALLHLEHERHAEAGHMADSWASDRSEYSAFDEMDGNGGLEVEGGDAQLLDSELQDNPNEDGSEDGDDDDMLDDRMSSSPSIDDNEDIDPDFVYALHNFVATVEGQANASKGDTMVLLDDSNSYWWLVRLVKDSSIGYLPAEHIELPVEREARQNKHRNLELARTHLLDEPGRSKNPLKKAMRRRNARRVDFSSPTFYEAREIDWSDNESPAQGDISETQETLSEIADPVGEQDGTHSAVQQQESALSSPAQSTAAELSPQSPQAEWQGDDADYEQESTLRTTKSGTIRNTDSFFANEAEPRKISLTPNILREGSQEPSLRSSGSTDKAPSGLDVADIIDKTVPKELRDDKKRKEKKQGMLSGLFKRKDKKIKVDEAAGGFVIKHETDEGSGALSAVEATVRPSSSTSKRPSSSGKLTKPPPIGMHDAARTVSNDSTTPISTPISAHESADEDKQIGKSINKPFRVGSPAQRRGPQQPDASSPADQTGGRDLVQGQGGASPTSQPSPPGQPSPTGQSSPTVQPSPTDQSGYNRVVSPTLMADAPRVVSPILEAGPIGSPPTRRAESPQVARVLNQQDAGFANPAYKTSRTTSPVPLHGSPRIEQSLPIGKDAPASALLTPTVNTRTASPNTSRDLNSSAEARHRATPDVRLPGAWNDSQTDLASLGSRRNDGSAFGSPDLAAVQEPKSSGSEKSSSRTISPLSDEEILNGPSSKGADDGRVSPVKMEDQKSAPLTDDSTKAPQWDNASLLAYIDGRSEQDARDLLILVNDPTGVVPLPLDHPTMLGFGFHEHQRQLNDMSAQLDGLLSGFLARRAARPKPRPV